MRKRVSTHAASVEERFLARVQKGDGCWEWQSSRARFGHGLFYVDQTNVPAHRYAYRMWVGPIPLGMCVCHSCDNPPCVNPAHLWLGTQRDNVADMVRKGRQAKGPRVTHCCRGHERSEDNIVVKGTAKKRHCRTCLLEAKRVQERRRKMRRAEKQRSA
jgi:hypothetical protein